MIKRREEARKENMKNSNMKKLCTKKTNSYKEGKGKLTNQR